MAPMSSASGPGGGDEGPWASSCEARWLTLRGEFWHATDCSDPAGVSLEAYGVACGSRPGAL